MRQPQELIVQVRDASDWELARLYEIEVQSFPDPWSANLFFSTLKASNTHCRVLTLRGSGSLWHGELGRLETLIGYLIYQSYLDESHILNFAIDPQYRNFGYGRMLLETVLDEMRRGGIHAVFLEYRRGNHVAEKLYAAAGFESCGERKNYYENRDDAIVMIKQLSPSI